MIIRAFRSGLLGATLFGLVFIFGVPRVEAHTRCNGRELEGEIRCIYSHAGLSPVQRTVTVTVGRFGKAGVLPVSISEVVSLTAKLKAWIGFVGTADCRASQPSEYDVWLVKDETNLPLLTATSDTVNATDSLPYGQQAGLTAASFAGGTIPTDARLACELILRTN